MVAKINSLEYYALSVNYFKKTQPAKI